MESIVNLAWRASGKEIIFTTSEGQFPGFAHIAACDFHGHVRDVLKTHESMLMLDASPKDQLLIASLSYNYELLLEGPRGWTPIPLHFQPAHSVPSPDGSRIAITAKEINGDNVIYLLERPSQKVTRIDKAFLALAISPDNQQILVRKTGFSTMNPKDVEVAAIPVSSGSAVRYCTQGLKDIDNSHVIFIPGTQQVCVLENSTSQYWKGFILDPVAPPKHLEVSGSTLVSQDAVPLSCGYLYRSEKQWFLHQWGAGTPRMIAGLTVFDWPVAWDPKTDELVVHRFPYDPSNEDTRGVGVKEISVDRYGLKTGKRRFERTIHFDPGEYLRMRTPSQSASPNMLTRRYIRGNLYLVDGALEP
jgi:hypothetical protein